ncbi:methyltransferase domain-containing protein [Aeromonas rivipollensis]|uniref:Class I SAM-dependent methyltransferase n=1 Tax=Aeromonas rivipollensis TaxID=948519 RepID=A0AAW9YCX7_9GAMM|nr:class I SAM-dependent methyltransferase [Aeromonas rivipollensis]AVP94765.1 methyltransferase type 11 [Aeromonas rivipollensis]NEX75367.1 class I SAM-dependent methyltransferase [Aeromonas rivipollensis]
MHPSALYFGKKFFDTYIKDISEPLNIIEVGSQDVNGSIRDFFVCKDNIIYTGLDFTQGKGVDILISDPYRLPVEDASTDVVVTSSCLEHSELFWLSFSEMLRILKPGGLIYMNVPSNGYIHRYPVDCWRFYPDSGKALETWGRRCGYGVTLLESFTSAQFSHLQEDRWSDYIAVFAKGDICVNNIQRMSFCSDKTLKNVYTNIHGNQDTDFTPEDFKIQEKYKNQVADIQKRLDLVVQSYENKLAQKDTEIEQLKSLLTP